MELPLPSCWSRDGLMQTDFIVTLRLFRSANEECLRAVLMQWSSPGFIRFREARFPQIEDDIGLYFTPGRSLTENLNVKYGGLHSVDSALVLPSEH